MYMNEFPHTLDISSRSALSWLESWDNPLHTEMHYYVNISLLNIYIYHISFLVVFELYPSQLRVYSCVCAQGSLQEGFERSYARNWTEVNCLQGQVSSPPYYLSSPSFCLSCIYTHLVCIGPESNTNTFVYFVLGGGEKRSASEYPFSSTVSLLS